MAAAEDVIFQGMFYKLSESRKRIIGSRADTWKPKYIILRKKEDKPVLEYHKKKPKKNKKSERTVTDTFELWPSYKVEKLRNARGRTFVCEITSSDFHLFLSADSERDVDIFVYLLQVQIRLKDNIREDLISVVPEESVSQQKIGANGNKCILHASPWGLTLALEQTRALLAQWPLKSIRYYETSGHGHFNIEAGRVAPMGEGQFGFQTSRGEDDFLYDLVDSYIVNTLDRVKPSQRGTTEEIEDYIREHDHLHSLTCVKVTLPSSPEVESTLKRNWKLSQEGVASASPVTEATASPSSSRRTPDSNGPAPMQSSSLHIQLERPSDNENRSLESNSPRRTDQNPAPGNSVSDRRPPLPTRGANSIPRRSRRRDHSVPRKVDVMDKLDSGEFSSDSSPLPSPRRHSNPSNIVHQVNSLPLSVDTSTASPRHTEFYHLNSPNMKVRVSKSPVITRNPNKVGRAEYLMTLGRSGVKSPTSSSAGAKWELTPGSVGEEDHQEALEYLDAVARASQQTFGGHNSIDRRWAKLQRLPSGDTATSPTRLEGHNSMPRNFQNPVKGRYVNIAESSGVHHSRQMSADGVLLSQSDPPGQEVNDHALSPPVIRHSRQRSAEEMGDRGPDLNLRSSSSDTRPQSAGSTQERSDPVCRNKEQSARESKSSDRQLSQISGFSAFDPDVKDVQDWLVSASCEDLSDHMRTVIYDDNNNSSGNAVGDGDGDNANDGNTYEEIDSSKSEASSKEGSLASSDKPPLPFTGLKKFHDQTDVGFGRDRSKSFGYMNINHVASSSSSAKPPSAAPSAHLIRKMVTARAKQETLRKSLSNPNFLNLGSKEHLYVLKSSNTKLSPQVKQKSKSFGSLFPAIKRALSRESLGRSRENLGHGRSATPERRASFSHKRRSSETESESGLKRRSSLHSVGELTIKGIRMTERSRSFRRVRAAKSAEVLSQTDNERGASENNRLSSGTTISSPAAMSGTKEPMSQEEAKRASSASAKTEAAASPGPTAASPSYISSMNIALSPSDSPPAPPLPAPRKKSLDGRSSVSISPVKQSGSSLLPPSSNYVNTSPRARVDSSHKPGESKDEPKVISGQRSSKVQSSRRGSQSNKQVNGGQTIVPPPIPAKPNS